MDLDAVKVLGLDPSSTCTGYAVLTGLDPAGLLDAGLLRPSLARAALAGRPAWQRAHLAAPELTATRRVLSLAADVAALLDEHAPDRVVVEVPSGRAGTGSKRGARGSLTTYGLAAGVLYQVCEGLRPGLVAPVTERQWTAGQGGKPKRQAALAAVYAGRYDPAQDAGGDAADAIGLARWWLGRGPESGSE